MTVPAIPPGSPTSPKWGSTTKLIVGLTLVAVIAALVVRFRLIIGPLILAFILAYLLHPLAVRVASSARLTWRASVNLIYLVLVIFLVGLITLTGLAVIQQLESIVGFIERFVADLPNLVTDLSSRTYLVGPFIVNISQLNLPGITSQLLPTVQALLDRVGGLVSTLATSALSTLGWAAFVLLISYFLLSDAGQFTGEIVRVDIPGYNQDIRRLGTELRLTWNAFLRGQLIIFLLAMIFYTMLMTLLGVHYAFGIAILAGMARFVPYLGPLTAWIITALVAFFQGGNYFGLDSLKFAIIVVVAAILMDQIFDNLIVPRFLGHTLGVHPAAVLVVAIIAASLIGIIGLLLAAPVLATVQLLGRYVIRKLFDLDPWPETKPGLQTVELPWTRSTRRLRAWWRSLPRRSNLK